eukprot:7406805-Heterocapsa_arctica.AAC.1
MAAQGGWVAATCAGDPVVDICRAPDTCQIWSDEPAPTTPAPPPTTTPQAPASASTTPAVSMNS